MGSFTDDLCATDHITSIKLSSVSLSIGFGILLLNSTQLCHLRRIGRTHNAYTYLPFLYSMAVSDLIVGVGIFINSAGRIILKEGDKNLCAKLGTFFGLILGRGSSFISLCTIVVFTVVKMLRVTCNVHVSHSILKKVCAILWIVGYMTSAASAFFDQDHTSTVKKISVPCFVVLALSAIIASHLIIYFKVRQSELEIGEFRFTGPPGSRHHQANQHQNKFKWISLLHIVSFIFTVAPYSVYNLISLTMKKEEEQSSFKVKFFLTELLACNSLLDSIIYFILFQPCRRVVLPIPVTNFVRRGARGVAERIDDLQLDPVIPMNNELYDGGQGTGVVESSI